MLFIDLEVRQPACPRPAILFLMEEDRSPEFLNQPCINMPRSKTTALLQTIPSLIV